MFHQWTGEQACEERYLLLPRSVEACGTGLQGQQAGFAEVERGGVGGVVEEEDGGCVVGFFIVGVVARLLEGGVGGGMREDTGEEDAVGVDKERCEQWFGDSDGGGDGVVEDVGAVRGGEDVDFEGGGIGGVEDGEQVGVRCWGGGAGRGEGCHGGREKREEGGGCGGVGWGGVDCLADLFGLVSSCFRLE